MGEFTLRLIDNADAVAFSANVNADIIKAQQEHINELHGQLAMLREHFQAQANLLAEGMVLKATSRLSQRYADVLKENDELRRRLDVLTEYAVETKHHGVQRINELVEDCWSEAGMLTFPVEVVA